MLSDVELRPATSDDLAAVADLYLEVRTAAVPTMPPIAHTADEVHAYVGGWDLSQRDVWLAIAADRPAAFMVVERDWLDSLYVAPQHQRAGLGGQLLDVAQSLRPNGFCLWVFESNTPARSFYAGRGCMELERTDGSGNEERAPDLKLAWPGADPIAFFRGLIDEVDAELGDLLARRAALTAAVQREKPATDRDPDREREIAEAMAARAPLLGPDRVARIVHAIITESLDAAT